jgi:hypothetical protein
MIKRALNAGAMAGHLLAGAWFGTQATVRLTQETALVPVPRTRKNKMEYRISGFVGGQTVTHGLGLQSLYKHCVRKAWQPVRGRKHQAKAVDAEPNLAQAKGPEQSVKVRLLFVRGNAGDTQATVGKQDWAVFLATDIASSAAEILGLYSMRRAMGVCFKEAKQHLGFLFVFIVAHNNLQQ